MNADCGVSKDVVWDAFKAVARDHFISVASACKKAKEKTTSDLKSKIAFLESRHLRLGGKKMPCRLEAAHKKLALYETSQMQHDLLFLKQKYS